MRSSAWDMTKKLVMKCRDCFGESHTDLDPTSLAIIRVVDAGGIAGTGAPTSTDWGDAVQGGECIDMDECKLFLLSHILPRSHSPPLRETALLVPLVARDAPTIVDTRVALNMTLIDYQVENRTESRFQLNH